MSSSRKKIILDARVEKQEIMKSKEKSKYVGKYKWMLNVLYIYDMLYVCYICYIHYIYYIYN